MRKIQQTNVTTSTNPDSSPIEIELNSFIEKAIKEGYSIYQAAAYASEFVKANWYKHVELPEENEEKKEFREKAKKFLDATYEQFDSWCSERSFCQWSWKILENDLGSKIKKRLIYEVAGSLYKGFEMETLDKRELRIYVLERVKKLIPEIKKAHSRCFNIVLSALLEYAWQQDCPEACEEFLNQFEILHSYDRDLCKFVWMVENQ